MEPIKISVIKNTEQYYRYCDRLEDLVQVNEPSDHDEVELLTLLIGKWDTEHNTLSDSDPVDLLKALMKEHQINANTLAGILGLSKGTISKILNYHKGFSKETIRKLADYFKVSQEAFNRPYKLKNEVNRHFREASLMNTRKNMIQA